MKDAKSDFKKYKGKIYKINGLDYVVTGYLNSGKMILTNMFCKTLQLFPHEFDNVL